MSYYVVVDIGCIECGEETAIVGIFTDEVKAESLATGSYFTSGQRSREMFEVQELDQVERRTL